MKNEKNYVGFLFLWIWQNLKRFGGQKVEHKPLFLEVCYIVIKRTFRIPISWKPTGVEKFIMYISGSATSLSPYFIRKSRRGKKKSCNFSSKKIFWNNLKCPLLFWGRNWQCFTYMILNLFGSLSYFLYTYTFHGALCIYIPLSQFCVNDNFWFSGVYYAMAILGSVILGIFFLQFGLAMDEKNFCSALCKLA